MEEEEEEGPRRCKCKGSMGGAFCPLCPLCPAPVGRWEVVRRSQLAESRGPGDSQSKTLAACNYPAIVLSCRLLYSHLSHPPPSPPWKEESYIRQARKAGRSTR